MSDKTNNKETKAPTPEEKRANFVKLAEGRTQAALAAIQKIGNLSNERAYGRNPADIKKIASALKEAIAEMERKFDPKTEKKVTFKL
ncbi:hypothetical protein CYG48_22140 (plasmid) [Neorhizobium sp. SOG26]|uniref:hypothetical protein n=1 Tax=Neorhizobium sp. SOG26 TaxID=2060726 RepID=UPI000E596223|nr:hypothetical protein [Neorhizobium sp. SOG26]AXV18540.1 hypothetical protein CYG48_22140 [Neorhizobium sp. SOG26]